jgi:hypothetical protein
LPVETPETALASRHPHLPTKRSDCVCFTTPNLDGKGPGTPSLPVKVKQTAAVKGPQAMLVIRGDGNIDFNRGLFLPSRDRLPLFPFGIEAHETFRGGCPDMSVTGDGEGVNGGATGNKSPSQELILLDRTTVTVEQPLICPKPDAVFHTSGDDGTDALTGPRHDLRSLAVIADHNRIVTVVRPEPINTIGILGDQPAIWQRHRVRRFGQR